MGVGMPESENRSKIEHSLVRVEGACRINFDFYPPEIALKCAQFLGSYVSENTIKNYARHLRSFFEFCREKSQPISKILEIQRDHVDAYKRYLVGKNPPVTVCAKLAPVLSFLKFCHQEGWTDRNVGSAIKLPRVQKHKGKTEALSEEEVGGILETLEKSYLLAMNPLKQKDHYKAWLRFVVFSTLSHVGMRATELCSLKIIDLDISGKLPRLHLKIKGGMLHSPLISDELAALLKKYIVTLRPLAKPEDSLFTLSPYSKRPLSRDYLARLVTTIAKENGISKEISPHSCRATVASHLHRNGTSLSEIQDLLGHKSMMTTMMYIRKTDEEKESASRKVKYSKVTKED
ncbi:tyrosine-type recombinase/integrase [Silvanigrella sp.]|jgi:integrase/recombinase XerD|uniref:tyrosine-type recombinase/integrase n=1 Tax=Silvanigrella sp. TaxID=2024976 RepID=UPI0037C82903